MAIANYHIHTTLSDGKFTPEEVIKQAIDHNIKYIALTDHHPLPNRDIANWDAFRVSDETFEQLQSLKETYKGQINVALGVEMDWLESHQEYTQRELEKRDYDFVIGSLHFMRAGNSTTYVPFHLRNSNKEALIESVGGIEGLIKSYYKQMRLMVDSQLYDCIGHIDRIRIATDELGKREQEVKQLEIEKTLERVKQTGMAIEINTYGIDYPPSHTPYIQKETLKRMRELGIPITIGNDGHSSITKWLEKGYELAIECGYNRINIFEDRKRRELPIDDA